MYEKVITMKKETGVEAYISSFPAVIQEKLNSIRMEIKKSVPKAEECMCYGIPTFKLNGNLVHYAAYENHIGFYPGPSGISSFKKELSKYKTSKGTVQFPLNKRIPLILIKKIVRFRVNENLDKI